MPQAAEPRIANHQPFLTFGGAGISITTESALADDEVQGLPDGAFALRGYRGLADITPLSQTADNDTFVIELHVYHWLRDGEYARQAQSPGRVLTPQDGFDPSLSWFYRRKLWEVTCTVGSAATDASGPLVDGDGAVYRFVDTIGAFTKTAFHTDYVAAYSDVDEHSPGSNGRGWIRHEDLGDVAAAYLYLHTPSGSDGKGNALVTLGF